MRHFRSIVLILTVLLQTVSGPVGLCAAMTVETPPKCEMGCCAWVQEMEQEDDSCTCAPATEERYPATPPSIPSQSTRDVIPVVYWKAQEDVLQPAAATSEPRSNFVMTDASEQAAPHVRLPVLFCAILI